MSFNKRYFTKDQILQRSTQDFNTFEKWIVNPDAHFLSDDFSKSYIRFFLESNKEVRILLQESLSEEDNFLKDLIKLIDVNTNEKNKDSHSKYINNYKELFFSKWFDTKYEKYKQLI